MYVRSPSPSFPRVGEGWKRKRKMERKEKEDQDREGGGIFLGGCSKWVLYLVRASHAYVLVCEFDRSTQPTQLSSLCLQFSSFPFNLNLLVYSTALPLFWSIMRQNNIRIITIIVIIVM